MLYPKIKALTDENPDATLLQIKRGGRYLRYTRRRVCRRALALAAHLAELGVKPGDHVALFADNGPEWVIAYLGAHFAGAAVVPLDAQYTELELATLIPFAEARVVLTTTRLRRTADWPKLGVRHVLLTDPEAGPDGTLALPDAPDDFAPPVMGPDDLMSLIFTSGTTGDPKCAMLTCGNFVSNTDAILQVVHFTSEDNLLSILPLHHCYAFTATILAPMFVGGTTTFETTLKGPAILAAMRETGVSVMPGVPKLFALFLRRILSRAESRSRPARFAFHRLLGLSRFLRRRLGLHAGRILFPSIRKAFGPRFRFFVSGGAKLDRDVCLGLLDLGIPVLEGYGLTETAPILTMTPPAAPRPGTIGRALPGVELRIEDPDPDGVGEIIVRGPNVMKGYYRRPDATAEMIRDGWLHTGDLGYIDPDGYVTITGRAKEVIVLSTGKNVYPEDVEKHYLASPLIAEFCVSGIEDAPGQTSRLAAIVVPDFDELKRRDLTGVHDEIKFEIENISHRIPTYMRVSEFRVVAQPLPRTRLGKLKRAEIGRMTLLDYHDGQIPRPQPTAEDLALLQKPSAGRFLDRLAQLAGYRNEILPGDNLELDIGLDSLARVELLVVMQQEFGTIVPAEEAADMITVRDVLRRLPAGDDPLAKEGFSWADAVRQLPDPPFEKRYSLRRPLVDHLFMDPVRFLGKGLFRLLFRVRLEGAERLPARGPYLLCPNHQSLLDAVLLMAVLPARVAHRIWFFALATYFRTPPLSWLVRLLRIIPTGTEQTMRSSMQYAFTALDHGQVLCLFPEGGRSPDGRVREGKLGVGVLACESRTSIYTVRIEGAMNTFSRTRGGLHLSDIRFIVGPRIDPPRKAAYTEEDYRAVAAAWRRAVQSIDLPNA